MSEAAETRDDYPHVETLQTRWADNDVYGHVNNVEYYAFFDTVINRWLIREGGLDIHGGDVIGVCAESHCTYRDGFAFPEDVEAGLRVGKLGNSSVTLRDRPVRGRRRRAVGDRLVRPRLRRRRDAAAGGDAAAAPRAPRAPASPTEGGS